MLSQNEYNAEVFKSKGLNGWRKLYLKFIERMEADSAVEFGAGDPALLAALPDNIVRKLALDGTDMYRAGFEAQGVSLAVHDLDQPGFKVDTRYDIAICSDVFEHLIKPDIALATIAGCVKEDGVLFAHVPNEFSLKKTVNVMLGRREAIYSHSHCEEFNHPHLHRFSDIGFRKFLGLKFKYLVKIADLRYGRSVKLLQKAKIPVPYCLEGGPTYLCTNDPARAKELQEIKDALVKEAQAS